MAQFNSTANRFPQTPPGSQRGAPGLPWLLLLFSIILFVFSLVIYGGLQAYASFLDKEIQTVSDNLRTLQQSRDAQSQRTYLDFYSQITNIRKVLEGHVELSKFFKSLEDQTNTRVRFNSVSVNVKRNEVSLQGVAESYERLAEQLEAFRLMPKSADDPTIIVTKVLLQSSNTAVGKAVDFSILLTVKPAALK